MPGVYGNLDDESFIEGSGVRSPGPGDAMESSPETFTGKLTVLKDQIDRNMEYIYNYLDSLKATADENYANFRAEYDELAHMYNAHLEQAMTIGQMTVDANEEEKLLDQLRRILETTSLTVEDISAQGFQMPVQSVEQEGTVPTGDPGTTTMIRHADSPPSKDEIIYEGAGPVRAWWDGMSPETKGVFKAVGIGAMLYGGKMAFEWFLNRWASKKGEQS